MNCICRAYSICGLLYNWLCCHRMHSSCAGKRLQVRAILQRHHLCQQRAGLVTALAQLGGRDTCQSPCTASPESAEPAHLSGNLCPGVVTATATCDMATLPKFGCIQLAALRLLLMEGQVAHELP